MLVFGEPSGSMLQKARKDLLQAAALLDYLKSVRAWDVEEAWVDLVGRGRGWTTRARQGLDALAKAAPELGVKEWLRFKKANTPRRRG